MTVRAAPRAMVLGCAGVALDDGERRFMADADPAGFILFKRNCESPAQTRALIGSLREAVGRPDAPVLVDQEGGRVVRLGSPHWREPPAPALLGALAEIDEAAGARAAWLNARLMAADLHALGFSVNCVPVLDLRYAGASKVVGDRSLGADPRSVARLGRAVADGLRAGGIVPAVKHLPGHGRAEADSHAVLPHVDAPLEALRARDFVPFRALRDVPVGLTAHVCYAALDPERPGTLSPEVIARAVRGRHRLRRPAGDRRSVHGGVDRLGRRARGHRARRRLRPGPALQRQAGGNGGRRRGRADARRPGAGAIRAHAGGSGGSRKRSTMPRAFASWMPCSPG